MPSTPDLILLPGLRADERQFEPQRVAFPGLRVARWIHMSDGDSLPDYAARMVPTLAITPRTVLAGSSFGGMVALEIARLTHPRCVVLIGSCRAPAAISPLLFTAARILKWFPPWTLQALEPLGLRMIGPPEHRRLLRDMAATSPPEFLRRAGGAVLCWRGCEDPGVPVHHVHGQRDRIIPARRVAADVVVPGAGHLLNLTHPDEVNAFLRRWLDP